jgi:TraM recognition site of TraD and TraG
MTHTHIIGQTGAGKTSYLLNHISQNIAADIGFCFVDPHGDAAREALFLIPKSKANNLIYIDVSDTARPVGLNFIADIPEDERAKVTQEILSTIIHLFGRDAIGPRSQQVLRNSIRTLLDVPDTTLLQIPRLLTDDAFRQKTYKYIGEASVRAYWIDQFDAYDKRFRSEVIAPVLNKLDAVFFSPALRNIISQPRSTFDFRVSMDRGQIVIVNLAKGQIGDDPAHILGALIVSAITHAAFSRFDTSAADRRPFNLIVDEFQNFTTDTFPTILSEARKYQLFLTLAHQFMNQLPASIQTAVLGNVSHTVAFRLGAEDATIIGDHIDARPQALMDLANFTAYERAVRDNRVQEARMIEPPPPPEPARANISPMLENCRIRYGRAVTDVERYIRAKLDPAF